MKLRQRVFVFLGCLVVSWIGWQPPAGYGQDSNLVISRVGLSQAQGTTFLTTILSRAAQPKIQPVVDRQAPQLLIDFPSAKVLDVPAVQAGDQQLVRQVRTVALPGGDGVRIILDLVPGRPYTYWRSSRGAPKGGFQFMVGIKPDFKDGELYSPGLAVDRRAGSPTQEKTDTPPPPRTAPPDREPRPREPDYRSADADTRRPMSSSMGEIFQLMPTAGPTLALLEEKGWSVQKDTTGRGAAGSRKFLLTSSQYPNLSVTAEHIPTKAEGSTPINVITVATDKIADSDADQYRQKIRWDMATIKKHYEDIGDYYDDGLKPLRLRLRERSKAAMLRDFDFIKQFLETAVPRKPELVNQVKQHLDERANKRLEGAQYTESENPLVILDMVDFYSLRVYFIGR